METTSTQHFTNRKWYEIWWDVWRHPGTGVFRRLLQEPHTDYVWGFKWVALIAVIVAVLNILFTEIYVQMVAPAASSSTIKSLVWGVIVAPIAAIMGITILAGIYHWVAKLFGGNGKWGQLVYCFSAILAPLYLLAALFYFLYMTIVGYLYSKGGETAVVQIGEGPLPYFFGLPMLVLPIYLIVLSICAIKAVENINTWRSILTYFIPWIVAIFLVGGVTVFLMLLTW